MTVDELSRLMKKNSNDIAVVDARPRTDFLKGHIPGAIPIAWEQWSMTPPSAVESILKAPGYWGTLADPYQRSFDRKLADLGLYSEKQIVVYADGRKSKGREGRIAWMLLFFGARNLALLDGGYTSWREAKQKVETSYTQPGRGTFRLSLSQNRRLTTSSLANRLGKDEFPHLLDTRSQKEFKGRIFWYQPRMGRLPGSSLIVFDKVFDTDGKHFVCQQTYKSLLPDGFGKGKESGTYCEVGVRACTVSLLHEIYTGEVLPVYDGSMMEWSLDPNLPVYK